MTDAELLKHLRILAQHAETIAARCRVVELALTKGEVFGLPVPPRIIESAVRDIESRFVQAAQRIGIGAA